MALTGTRANFVEEMAVYSCNCSECLNKISKGSTRLVSRRNGRVMKVVCSEECRQDFEARFLDEVANNHERSPRWQGIRKRDKIKNAVE